MLTERRADYMMETNLSYANGMFENLHPHDFLKLMTLTEDIMLKREASKRQIWARHLGARVHLLISIRGVSEVHTSPQATRASGNVKSLPKK